MSETEEAEVLAAVTSCKGREFCSRVPYLPGTAVAEEPVARNRDAFYGQSTLPAGIRSRRIHNNNGVTLHIRTAPPRTGYPVP